MFTLVCQDFGFRQDIVSIKKEGGQEFRSLEVRRKLIALKNGLNNKEHLPSQYLISTDLTFRKMYDSPRRYCTLGKEPRQTLGQ